MSAPHVEQAKRLLEADGYTVIRTRSHAAAQQRLAIALHEAQWCRDELARTQRWAEQDLSVEIRALRDRVTFLYGAALVAGAKREDLVG